MTKDNKVATDVDDIDPLDELNQIKDKSQIVETIETEKDPLEVLEQQDAEDIPEYNSELGSIVDEDDSAENKKTENEKSLSSEETDKKDIHMSLMDVIDEVDINNKTEDSKLPTKENTTSKLKLSKKSSKKENEEDTTKVIDDVKVDEEGVPLLNQFDSNAFKGVFHKHVKQHVTKIAMIVIGAIITLIGVLQAINDVVKISDNVIYGEHEAVAMGLIFIGLIIVIFAFYKELLEFSGLNDLSNHSDSVNSDGDMPKPKHNNKRKEEEN